MPIRRAIASPSLLVACLLASLGSSPTVDAESLPRPSLEALRIDDPIEVDGVLDEPAWQRAPKASGFTQREPVELAPATESTDVRVVYTADTLYVGVRAHDRQPDALVAGEMGLDVGIFRDDGIVVLLDTFHDRRNAYFFETNPNSSRTDGLVTDEGRDFSIDFDTIWNVRTSVDADGWTAEFAIPFSSLRFDAALDTWGFQVRRIIKRKEEFTFWSPIDLQSNLFRLSDAGTLTGLGGLQTGRDLRIKPFVVASTQSSREGDGDGESFDAGLDVKWGVTDGLTLDLTVNTDFAETEVDEIQTNLTRFPLFFPEKREFFLENAGIFQFGPDLGPFLRPFFSRRIGIARDGRQVDLDVGARLAGRHGEWNIGLLGARTGSLAADPTDDLDAVPETTWGVARVKRNVGERSFVGLFASHRRGDDGDWQRVVGADVNWKPNERWSFWAFGATTDDDEDVEDADTVGVSADYRADVFRSTVTLWDVGENWNPDAGFIIRNGFRNLVVEATWDPRSTWKGIRNAFYQLELDYIENAAGEKESVEIEVDVFGLRWLSGDFATLLPSHRYERLDEPFEIAEGVIIPAGEHEFNDVAVFLTTTNSRPVDTDLFIRVGEFFDGDRFSSNFFVQWRPSRHFRSRTTWAHDEVDLPGGSFDTNIVRQRFEVSITPDLVINALIQASDASDDLGLNLRLNWHYRPGSDLFVVYNHGWDAPDLSNLRSRARQLTVKWTWAWQS